MKKSILVILTLIVSTTIIAQTKRIAHRSHSGKDKVAFGTWGDNFGLPPTVKQLTDTTKANKKKIDSIPAVKPVTSKPVKKKKTSTT